MLKRTSRPGYYNVCSRQPNCPEQTLVFTGRIKSAFKTDKTELVLLDTEAYGEVLFMNSEVQSSSSDEHIYHEALVRPAFLTAKSTNRTLLLGGGEGCAARDMFKWGAGAIDQYDYDKVAVTWMRNSLREWHGESFSNPQLNLVYADARDALQIGRTYDVIIVDLYDPTADDVPSFVELLLGGVRCLNAGGALAAYIGDAPCSGVDYDDSVVVNIVQRLCTSLPGAYVHPYRIYVPAFAAEACFVLVAPGGAAAMPGAEKFGEELGKVIALDEVNWVRAATWATGSPPLFRQLSGKYVESCMVRAASNADKEESS